MKYNKMKNRRSKINLMGIIFLKIFNVYVNIMLCTPAFLFLAIQKETFREKIIRMMAILLILIFPFIILLCFKVIKQYKKAVILRFGKVREDSPAGPGVIWLVPCTDDVLIVDMRTQSLNLPSQEILTNDSVSVAVNAVIYYHVTNPLYCLLNVESHKYATELIAIATLKNVVGQYTLKDLLGSRDAISDTSKQNTHRVTAEWGIEIERVEIKEISLPFDLQKAMAAEAEGTRVAKAKLIEAKGEIKTAEYLREASKIIMENPQIMLLRYLETFNHLASEHRTSIFFPFPLDIPEPQ